MKLTFLVLLNYFRRVDRIHLKIVNFRIQLDKIETIKIQL